MSESNKADILKWRLSLMQHHGLSALEANRLILDSLLVSGDKLVWAAESVSQSC